MNINLYVNSFINADSFKSLFSRLKEEGQNLGVNINVITNTDNLVSTFDFDSSSYSAIFWDKDYYLAKDLENLGVRLFNKADSIRICDDKGLTHLALKGKVPMPKTILCPKSYPSFTGLDYSYVDKVIEELKLPLIIKQSFGSFGKEVYLLNTREEVFNKVKELGAKPFIFQEFISSSYGKDVRIYLVGKKCVGAILRTAKDGFVANITSGGHAEEFTLPENFKQIAEKAAEILDLDFCGVDILFGKDGPLLCEVNSNAHFKGFESATGKNVAKEIINHVKLNAKQI